MLPDGSEVNRASGHAVCPACGKRFMDHEKFTYPSGMGHVVRDCEGKYWHL